MYIRLRSVRIHARIAKTASVPENSKIPKHDKLRGYQRIVIELNSNILPVLNPKSYDGARVLEASGRPMLGALVGDSPYG